LFFQQSPFCDVFHDHLKATGSVLIEQRPAAQSNRDPLTISASPLDFHATQLPHRQQSVDDLLVLIRININISRRPKSQHIVYQLVP
jgi:hypothetical protein